MKLDWNFQGVGWGVQTQKPSVEEGGMDIFWNHTMSLIISFHFCVVKLETFAILLTLICQQGLSLISEQLNN